MTTAFRARALALSMAMLVSGTVPCVAQTARSRMSEPAWLSLERGKQAFDLKDFGAALVHFDDAIAVRRDSFALAAGRLDQALESEAAKSAGDSIGAVLAAFASEDFLERDYRRLAAGMTRPSGPLLEALRKERISDSHRAFIDVLLSVLEYGSMESMNDSIAALRTRVSLLARYPEAEYWKGRVFFVEGELRLAELQYKRAYDMAASLEIHDEVYTVLYSMADLYDAKSDFVAWENVMRSIVAGNDAVIDQYLRDAMMATLDDDGFDRFMTLYRIEPSYTLEANAALAVFYLERGRASAAVHAAIAVNMTLTRAITALALKDRDYTWKGLDDFLRRAERRADVSAYLANAGLPGLLMTLADSLYVAGARVNAAAVWKAVAGTGSAPHSVAASARLANPSSAVRRTAP